MIQRKTLFFWELLFLIAIPLLLFINYLVFHVAVECLCALVAFFASYTIQRNKRLSSRSFYKVLSATMFCVALVDIFHLLAYKGMGVFSIDEVNVATQFWLVGRFILVVGLLFGTFLSQKIVRNSFIWTVSLIVTSCAIFAVFFGVFPDAFIEGLGLTQFKIISEYIIIGFLLFTILFLTNYQITFCLKGHLLLIGVIGVTALSELMFTLYQDVYGYLNSSGHILKLAAYLLLFHLFSLYRKSDEH